MTQSVEDEATRPIFYESRVMKLNLDKQVLDRIDAEYEDMAANAEPYHIAKSKCELGQMEAILGADETVVELCKDIIKHYDDRKHILAGKAMIVAYSRPIAMKIYQKILELRPGWKDKLGLVMTRNNQDPEEWFDIIGGKRERDDKAKHFKRPDDPLKICIVVDMWLTGFDVPCLNTMYIYKPMQGHTLMQAIARVNRVYKDKEGGLIIDYVGIAGALKKAMKDYTYRDKENFGNPDIGESALPDFQRRLEICRDLMHGLDYGTFFEDSDLERARVIAEGIDFILSNEETKKDYLREALGLRQAETLCRSLLDDDTRMETAYFETVKRVQDMKQKNLAAELLKRLLADEIKAYMRTNLVKSELFSEKMDKLMKLYRNGLITNAEVIEQLLKMAEEMRKAKEEGNELGLNAEELAFYDAITKPENIKDFYTNQQLINMTHELTEMLRKNRTIDWQLKEQARARMRVMIKRLLKKYKYPPEEEQKALDMVLKQAESMDME